MQRFRSMSGSGALLLALPAAASAFPADRRPKRSTGETARMLTSTGLVMSLIIPGPGLFCAGMVRHKNILATMAQTFEECCIVTIAWIAAGLLLLLGKSTVGGSEGERREGLDVLLHGQRVC